MKKPSYTHQEAFPLVVRAITNHSSLKSGFLQHTEIVKALLTDPQARPLIEAAGKANGKGDAWTASNMVQWFSVHFEKTTDSNFIERLKTISGWEYRYLHPIPTSSVPPDEEAFMATEGAAKLAMHLIRERDQNLIKKKRQQVLEETGALACESCGFEAAARFPGIDSHLIEVHHRNLLSASSEPVKTSLNDLAILCPTCHRAIHRTELTVEAFKAKFFGKTLLHLHSKNTDS